MAQKGGIAPTAFAVTAVAIAAVVALLHYYENHVYLQHLNRIPEEGLTLAAALQTENAFYYSYYSELVHADSALDALRDMVWDRRSEFPDVLNAVRRFNIYQEIVLALEYRGLAALGLAWVSPWQFFRQHILVLNGLGQGFLALLAAEMSGNPFAGAACFLASFLNRFQISRVGNYTSSNLRELWGIPLLWLQTWGLWRLLLPGGGSRLLWCFFGVVTFVFIVVWQFSPFLLLLQATAVYFVYLVCGYRTLRSTVVSLVDVYLLALGAAVVVHFGSPYLLTSPFLFQLIALRVALTLGGCRHRVLERLEKRWLRWLLLRATDVLEGLAALAVFVAVRKLAEPFATADTHVYEILCTKVSAINDLLPTSLQLPKARLPECAEPSFNARLYLIMGVFNLLERQSIEVYRQSLAGQSALLSCLLVALRCLLSSLGGAEPAAPEARRAPQPAAGGKAEGAADGGLRKRKGGKAEEAKRREADDPEKPKPGMPGSSHEEGAQLFVVVQSLLFLLLGALVNRLRVAFGPMMMLLASCCFGPRLFPVRPLLRRFGWATRAALFGLFCAQVLLMARKLPCISENEGVCHHVKDKSSNDGDLADLCHWMNGALARNTSVLSSMNLAGSLRLFTHVPLIVHPQFESENLRKRVQLGYELYHCGSEESFVKTMKELQAEVVVFEYNRCFFTPYLLDDKRKNCDSRKHAAEAQLCLKLHAQPKYFQRIFSNGNYAAFRLRKAPLAAPAPGVRAVSAALEQEESWREFVEDCKATQGELCGPRLLESAATWYHSVKRKGVAATLRKLGERHFPENGFVNYYLGRYYDYDAQQPQRALEHYRKAVKLLPNNQVVLKEYLMFLDMTLQDKRALAQLLKERRRTQPAGEGQERQLGLLDMEGPGVGYLLCEAAVSAKNTPGLEAWGKELWAKARRLAPLSECVKTNWQLIYGEDVTYESQHSDWDRIRLLAKGGAQHDVGSHNQPAVRFLGSRAFDLRQGGIR